MNPNKMKVEDCDLCPKNGRSGTRCVFGYVASGANGRKVTIKRCAYCDTTPCAVCRTRTMKVNQSRCGKCGHDLLPRSKK